MEALTGFAVLSLLSSLLLSLLPETRLKSTVHLVASLLLLLSWLTALQTLCTRFSQPESSASAASPLSETADFPLLMRWMPCRASHPRRRTPHEHDPLPGAASAGRLAVCSNRAVRGAGAVRECNQRQQPRRGNPHCPRAVRNRGGGQCQRNHLHRGQSTLRRGGGGVRRGGHCRPPALAGSRDDASWAGQQPRRRVSAKGGNAP